MLRRPRSLLITTVLAAACTAAPACVHAAELGDVRVTSHIGQPLTADIELTTIDDPAVPVGVRIASPDIYSGAGLALPPVLSSVTLSVTRRDGRQFIHVTSLRPVDADHVHLYLDLVERGQHAVRLATVWLTPDPTPPAPVPVAVPAPVAAAVPVPPAAPVRARVALAEPAPAPRASPKTEPAHADAVKAAAGPGVVAPAVAAPILAGHAGAVSKVTPAATAPDAAKSLRPDLLPKLPSLHPAPKQADASAAACTRFADDAPSCSALGSKNAELRAQLASLENKVKILQVKLGVTPAAPATAALVKPPLPVHTAQSALVAQAVLAAKAALPAKEATKQATKEAVKETPKEASKPPPQPIVKPVIPAGPKPISSIKTLVPHKAAAPDDDDSLPLGWIGAAAALLVLAGAMATLVARRRKTRRAAVPASAGLLGKLKQRFGKRAPAGESAPAAAPVAVLEHVEPSLE